jgi:Tfp pilus assembly protein FimV
MLRRSRRLLSTAIFSIAAAGALQAAANGAELGEARVSSHIGQQLVADIELSQVDDPAAQVSVRLASPEVYNGAGIALPSVLASLNLSVMRRDGRQFIHVTSLRPVEAEHLHLYLELGDKGQRAVRLVTLWLTPDPNPAPVPAPAPAPAPVPVAVPAPLPAPLPVRAAAAPVHAAPAALPAALPPTAPAPRPVRHVKPAPVAPITPVRKPVPATAHVDSQPAACAPQPDEAQACSALGVKNAALRGQLDKLEEKVKGLQQHMGVAPAAAAAKAAGGKAEMHKAEEPKAAEHKAEEPKTEVHEADEQKPQEHKPEEHKPEEHKPEEALVPPKPVIKPAGPKPISSIKPLVVHKPKVTAEEGGAPWGWIAAGIAALAVIGGGSAFLLRRRAHKLAQAGNAPDVPGMFDKLKQRFAARTRAEAPGATPEKIAEPSLD